VQQSVDRAALSTGHNALSIFVKYNYSIWFLNGCKVYSAFLDASKAFDKVLHNGLYKKLLDEKESSVVFCAMAD